MSDIVKRLRAGEYLAPGVVADEVERLIRERDKMKSKLVTATTKLNLIRDALDGRGR